MCTCATLNPQQSPQLYSGALDLMLQSVTLQVKPHEEVRFYAGNYAARITVGEWHDGQPSATPWSTEPGWSMGSILTGESH